MRRIALPLRSLLLVGAALAYVLLLAGCQDLTDETTTTTATEQSSTTSVESTTTTDPRVYMPQLVGLPEDEATSQLEALGVEYEVKGWPTPNNSKHGKVQEQDVPEGTEITAETEVVLKVGREGIEVPNLSGCPDYDAKGWVESLGLKISITYDPPRDPSSPSPYLYVVTSQSPGSGSYILVGGTVKVTCKWEM